MLNLSQLTLTPPYVATTQSKESDLLLAYLDYSNGGSFVVTYTMELLCIVPIPGTHIEQHPLVTMAML